MDHWITKQEYRIFRVLSGRANSYLIFKNDKVILADTGTGNAYSRLLRNIGKLDVKNKEIAYLFLTHTHFDHCQSAKLLKDKYNCKIVVSEKAVGSIANGYTMLPDGTFLISRMIVKLGRVAGRKLCSYRAFEPDILVGSEGLSQFDTLDIEIIETAGHSEDSISIVIDRELAIVGDSLFGVFRNSVIPPFAVNLKQMIENWGKLLETGCTVFLPGHGRAISRNLLEKEYFKFAKKYDIVTG